MALSKLAVRRLTKLADYMASLPKSANEHFNMNFFFHHPGEHSHPEIPRAGEIKPNALEVCGTSACAAGFATTIPAFRKAGLKLKIYGGGSTGVAFGGIRPGTWRPLSTFFDISTAQTEHLFGPHGWVTTPRQWARRCRIFLRKNA